MWDRYNKGFITSEELKWRRMWRTLLDFKIGDKAYLNGYSHQTAPLLVVTKVYEGGLVILSFYNRNTFAFDKVELPKECLTKVS